MDTCRDCEYCYPLDESNDTGGHGCFAKPPTVSMVPTRNPLNPTEMGVQAVAVNPPVMLDRPACCEFVPCDPKGCEYAEEEGAPDIPTH